MPIKIPSAKRLSKRYAMRSYAGRGNYIAGRRNPKSGKPSGKPEEAEKLIAAMPSSMSKWARAWEPYRRVLLRLKLPKKGPPRSAANLMRMMMVAQALHAEKVRREGKTRTAARRA